MTDSEFLALAKETLDRIETCFDNLNDQDVVDVECKRNGNVLEIEFIDNGTKIIVNSQAPLQEMWMAARAGGYHYKRVGDEWRNTRDNTEFFTALSEVATQQGGAPVKLG
ncbi:iron donor protein CyaY [Massilia sp. Dwa41.01b]|uniref:iron donor protein CyaY n=1 Tax=unclassified Massilia TaxID=2609279 RepID=UPI0016021CF8|nr:MULTISPECIES: iron donor protein CyaY [unclassified Massilia]QNA87637.1 iron donor protein CyaY [Massilia sp. Dwa41.01b]QNA98542.1 iron donor protein CyaY [Massilia sp. Se16.2.3]